MTTTHMPTPEERLAASKRMKERFGNPNVDAETLRRLYWDENLTLSEVADKVGFRNRESIHFWMRKYGIPRRNRSEARIGRPKKYVVTQVTRRKLSKMRKEWHRKHPEFKDFVRSISKRPTMVEQRVMELIVRNGLPLKYVGDRQFWVGNKYDHTVRNPDFIRTDVKKHCVEVFGERWHSLLYKPNLPQKYTYDGTIEHYSKYGWKCSILWDYELKKLPDAELVRMLMR